MTISVSDKGTGIRHKNIFGFVWFFVHAFADKRRPYSKYHNYRLHKFLRLNFQFSILNSQFISPPRSKSKLFQIDFNSRYNNNRNANWRQLMTISVYDKRTGI